MGLPTPDDALFDALEATRKLEASASNLSRIAKTHGETLSRWAFEQWELRKRARDKFANAEAMLFDREGLEMASHEEIARVHAALFPNKARVADLTCGIGADLIALARERDAVGYELNADRIRIAKHNLNVHGLDAEIRHEDSMRAEWDFEFAFADPARRTASTRFVDPDDYLPPLSELAGRMESLAFGLIKVSPMLPDDVLQTYGKRVDFLSFGRECREANLSVGQKENLPGLKTQSTLFAVHVETAYALAGGSSEPERLETPLLYLFEADPAAIRAHALGGLCSAIQAAPLGDSNGYLTGDTIPGEQPAGVFVRTYRVHASGHADVKRIRAELRRLDGELEAVKLRGFKDEPSAWQKRLGTSGSRKLVLILFPVGKSRRFALAETLYR